MEYKFPRNHPYRSFKEQLNLLKERNLSIDDEAFALEALKSLSYYSLINGYKDLFMYPNKDNFIEGTTFYMLYEMHWADLTISSILFKYTLVVEKKLKTQIGNLIARCFSIEERKYLDKKNYSTSPAQRGKYSNVINAIESSKKKDASVAHYLEHENNIPPWIATKAISFGVSVNWYSILRNINKTEVIQSFLGTNCSLSIDEQRDFFKIILGQVYEYRNLSAHGNRSFKLKLPEKLKHRWSFLEKLKIDSFFAHDGHPENKDNFFSIILSIFLLINDKFICKKFIEEIESFIIYYGNPDFIFLDKNIFQMFDWPNDIIDRLESFYSYKFDSK